jgi:hypothetical protein
VTGRGKAAATGGSSQTLSPFAPRKQRHFRGAKGDNTTLIDLPTYSDLFSEDDRQEMRKPTPAKIVLTLLGMTGVAALAMLAASVSSGVRQYNDYRRFRLAPRDGSPPVCADRPRTKPAAPAPARFAAVTRNAAEKMFPSGVTKDFGTVLHGTQLFHRFPITNIHAVPVTIAYLEVSCDCVTATTANRLLQPHESSTIDVALDAGHFAGENMQTVRVKVTGPDFESTCKLVVSAVSEAESPALLTSPCLICQLREGSAQK